ncbi:MAG: hypothetical protein LKJ47_04805 [Bifidobacteriaceae bacterium]|jgi:hypothetical protein|nr:hypothetical protein [Bifidobacteriaceae bacterium]
MSARPSVTPVRVEHYLLPFLCEAFPEVTFSTIRSRKEAPSTECVLVGEPQGMASPITQYVRLRMSVYATRADMSGDFQTAQDLAARIAHEILAHGTNAPFVDAELDSGPIRMADDTQIFAYGIILLTVSVA